MRIRIPLLFWYLRLWKTSFAFWLGFSKWGTWEYWGLHLFFSWALFLVSLCDYDVALSPISPGRNLALFLTYTQNHRPDLTGSIHSKILEREQLSIQFYLFDQFIIVYVFVGSFSFDFFHHSGNSPQILLRVWLNLFLLPCCNDFSD